MMALKPHDRSGLLPSKTPNFLVLLDAFLFFLGLTKAPLVEYNLPIHSRLLKQIQEFLPQELQMSRFDDIFVLAEASMPAVRHRNKSTAQ